MRDRRDRADAKHRTAEPGFAAPLFVFIDHQSARAFAGLVRRNCQGADPSALHELPSGRRAPPARGRPPRAHAARWRGDGGTGIPGLLCTSCHTEKNFTLVGTDAGFKSIPGHPRWGLAPIEMAWEGKSVGQICEQIKDQNRNGGRTLAQLHEHLAQDDLVAWGWSPGEGREAAPGTQAQLGELAKAWIDSGAECPN